MAEKKSTKLKSAPRKRAVNKLEEQESVTDAQRMAESVRPLNINWDVIGFSSAAIALAGAGLLFVMGWAYEVNWYGYFGVNMTQVSIPPQTYLVQSVPGIITMISFLLLSAVILAKPNHKGSKTITAKDLLPSLLWSQIVMVALLAFSYIFIGNDVKGIRDAYEFNYLFYIIGLPVLGVVIVIAVNIALYIVDKFVFRKSVRLFNLPNLNHITGNSSLMILLIIILSIYTVITSTAISAIFAILDASRGLQASGNWRVQKVYLYNLEEPISLEPDPQQCLNNACLYGPFGLIAENEANFLLIRWEVDKDQRFQYHPGLFILPRQGIAIIPADNRSFPISKSTLVSSRTPQPTQTVSPTLMPTNTITRTSQPATTPTATLVPNQP